MPGIETTRPITYRFRFDDGREWCFTVRLDPETLAVADPPPEHPPAWTRLEFHRCSVCPLDTARNARCPIAVRVVDVVEMFQDRVSFENVAVTVETGRRVYSRRTSLQKGLSSLLGIYMVSSGCPIMNKLRPMVDTHLPFASAEETTYRTINMYLMAQLFRKHWGLEPDFELRLLPQLIDAIREVDVGFCSRLRALGIEDASLNALVILSTFGEDVNFTLLQHDMDRWERIFRDHYRYR